MTTRHIVGYLLLMLMIVAGAAAVRWAMYNSERNVRRRERRARRDRYRTQLARQTSATDQNPDAGGEI